MIHCDTCGNAISDSRRDCPACGTEPESVGEKAVVADGGEVVTADDYGHDVGDDAFLFSSFADENEGLILAYSDDLYNWTQIPGPHLEPAVGDDIMRDPFISRGPTGPTTWCGRAAGIAATSATPILRTSSTGANNDCYR